MRAPAPSWNSRETWFLVAIALFTLAVQLVACTVLEDIQAAPRSGSDESEYDAYAWSLVQGRGYRGPSVDVLDRDHATAYRPPTASLYYAGVYLLFGHRYAAAHVANCVLVALTVLLVYAITRRCFGRGAARLAALAYACYPLAVYFNLPLGSETQGNFLLMLFVWCCLGVTGDRGTRWAIAAGVVLGVFLLCKPGFVLLLPLLPVWALVVCGKDRLLWLRAALIPLLAGLVLIPWVVRNRLVLGAFIPFGTGGGQLLLCGNNRVVVEDPRLYGYSVMDNALPEYGPALRAANNEVARDALAKHFAIDWLRANPDKWFYLLRAKFVRLWAPLYQGAAYRSFEWFAMAYYGLILALFAAALLPVTMRFLRERHPGFLLPCLVVATTGTAVVFHGQHRYRFTIDGLCIVMAAATVSWLAEVAARRSWRSAFALVRTFVAGRWYWLLFGALAAGAVAVAWKLDEDHIERYRQRVCRQKLDAIGTAAVAYRRAHGRWPSDVADLVPEFLPNADALHCPKHSVGWHDYQLLGSPDMNRAAQLISYEVMRPAEPGKAVTIREFGTSHFGAENSIRIAP
ncbi:MAG TPA: glycosyltransferase family 39 protein [Gemmataceae bacterium]|nr:glycosyltransferase family 39 protein [Gemmataceae bacterium]